MLVDAQSWWTPDGGETMHLHVGGEWPLYTTVLSGVVQIPITLKLHHAAGVIKKIDLPSGDTIRGTFLVGDPASAVVQTTITQPWDTTGEPSGETLFRVAASFTDAIDGTVRKARILGTTRIVNANPPSSGNRKELRAASWFAPSDTDGRGYTNASLHRDTLPTAPVSGVWRPKVKVGSSISGQTRHLFVSIDPDFHHADPALREGFVLRRTAHVANTWIDIPVDTARLSSGPHKLMIKGSDAGMFPRGTLEGALVVGFTVA